MATYAMRVRTGSWGWPAFEMSPHSPLKVELAPPDAPGVLVRLVHGPPALPAEFDGGVVRELSINDGSGKPRLLVRPADGTVERPAGARPEGEWELRLEGPNQRGFHLYAAPGTPFPSEQDLEALSAAVAAPTPPGPRRS